MALLWFLLYIFSVGIAWAVLHRLDFFDIPEDRADTEDLFGRVVVCFLWPAVVVLGGAFWLVYSTFKSGRWLTNKILRVK